MREPPPTARETRGGACGGAFIPGLILVAIYMLYILGQAVLRPKTAPPVPYEGRYDLRFAAQVLLALVPPLTLIFAVLGSIITGIATVNQAGVIGALIMGGYCLTAGRRNAFAPAITAVLSLLVLLAVLSVYDINIKHITGPEDVRGIVLASIGTAGLLTAIAWSLWRAYRIDDTLKSVMIETTKTTSMVFIILLGAAMLTSAFRAFGGEDLVHEHLTSLPGGFWTQFVVVMAVIILLGFFLDFIEIAVVVVPIVAPILLADPSANITAVWLGVMIGINIQTSFLTPPFGFALFYLRGVAPAVVKTLQIYRGAAVFIVLQLVGLGIAGVFPSLVNYLPNRVYLGSETAPPPMNPKLQHCLEEYVFARYDEGGDALRAHVDRAAALDVGYLPDALRGKYGRSVELAREGMDLAQAVRDADAQTEAYLPEYRPLHAEVRRKQSDLRKLRTRLEALERDRSRLAHDETADGAALDAVERARAAVEAEMAAVERARAAVEAEMAAIEDSIPAGWEAARARYVALSDRQRKARREYRQSVDEAYRTVADDPPEQAMETIKAAERELGKVAGSSRVKGRLSKARRALRGGSPDPEKAAGFLAEARERYAEEVAWRTRAAQELLPGLATYDDAIRHSIGLRVQERLTQEQAKLIAECQSVHRDVSLHF